MAYAPTVNDISGQILAAGKIAAAQAKAQGILGSAQLQAGGIVNAANTRLQGTQALAAGIGSAGSSIGSGIAQAGQIFARNQAQENANTGKINAYTQLGLLSPERADEISALNNRDKISGALAVYDDVFQKQISNAMALNQAKALRELSMATDRTGQTVPNAGNIPMIRTSDAQAQIIKPDTPAAPRIINSQQGIMQLAPGQNVATPILDSQGQRLTPMANPLAALLGGAPGLNESSPLTGTPVGAAGAVGNIPPEAIQMLKQNLSLAPQFDAKYGRGAAARVLQGP